MTNKAKGKEIYVALDRPRLRLPEFLDDHRMKLVRLSALRKSAFTTQEIHLVLFSVGD